MKVDKSVCTNEPEINSDVDNINRAQHFGAVFTTLLENKIIAIKKESEKKDQKHEKQKSKSSLFGEKLSSKQIFCIKRNSSDHLPNSNVNKNKCSSLLKDPTTNICKSNITYDVRNEYKNPTFLTDNVNAVNGILGESKSTDIHNKPSPIESSLIKLPLNDNDNLVCAKEEVNTISSVYNCESNNDISKNVSPKVHYGLDISVNKPIFGMSCSPSSSIFEIYLSDECFLKSGKSSVETSTDNPSLTSDNQIKFSSQESALLCDNERQRLRLLEAKSISAQCSPIFQRALRNRIEVKQGDVDRAKCDSDDIGNLQLRDAVQKNEAILQPPSSLLISKYKYSNKTYDKLIIHEYATDDSQGFINSFNQLTSNNSKSININFPVITTTKKTKSIHCDNNKHLSRYNKCKYNMEPESLNVRGSNCNSNTDKLDNHKQKSKKYSKYILNYSTSYFSFFFICTYPVYKSGEYELCKNVCSLV